MIKKFSKSHLLKAIQLKKKFIAVIALLFALFTAPAFAAGSNAPNTSTVCAYFFYKESCSHCENVDAALKAVEAKYPAFDANRIDVNKQVELLHGLYVKYDVPKYAVDSQGNYIPVWDRVPVLFIGKEYRIGNFEYAG